jgi:hypothetical protein
MILLPRLTARSSRSLAAMQGRPDGQALRRGPRSVRQP